MQSIFLLSTALLQEKAGCSPQRTVTKKPTAPRAAHNIKNAQIPVAVSPR